MTYQFRALADQAMADGLITSDEILSLRREGWADGRISPAEADALFELNDRLTERTPEWVDFFVEAIVDFVLSGGVPRGFVSDEQAEWLIARIDRNGQVETMAELDLLAHLFDKAELLPERLKRYAQTQIEQIVLTGSGPTRDGGTVEAGCITSGECKLLRRFIFAFAGDTAAGVSQAEAEMLFRLKDATLGASNATEWKDLFVQGLGNYLMGHNHFTQLTSARAQELETFMNDATPRLGSFMGRMATAGVGGGFARVLAFGRKGVAAPSLADEVLADRKITESEDAWLQARVDADHQIDELEKALLRFVAEEERR